MLTYLKIFGYQDLLSKSNEQIKQSLLKIWEEVCLLEEKENIDLKDYKDIRNLQKLSISLDMDKVILLLDDSPESTLSEYLSKLILSKVSYIDERIYSLGIIGKYFSGLISKITFHILKLLHLSGIK